MKNSFNIHEWQANQIKKRLAEQGFDDRFKGAMSKAGFSDEEMDDVMSRSDQSWGFKEPGEDDAGSPFPGTNNSSPFVAKAKDYIDTFRQEYRDMSDDGIDEFSVEIINHLLDNTAAQAAAKIYFGKKGW
jgi:hypothetical protein